MPIFGSLHYVYIHFGVQITIAWARTSVSWAKAQASPGVAMPLL